MVSVNEKAVDIARKMVLYKNELKIGVKRLRNGAFVLDCGIEEYGGIIAGKQFSEACMGGLAEIGFYYSDFGMQINVSTDYPQEACIASQMAGWNIVIGGFSALGSGPVRALARDEKVFRKITYKDDFKESVIVLETRDMPNEEVADYVAEKAGISPEKLYVLVAPTASLVGSIQISARVVETGLHKLDVLGFPLSSVISGFGNCPVAPVAKSDEEAMGITNDCILYGGQTRFFVDCEDTDIEAVIEKVPSSASREYGKPFHEIFTESGRDFCKVDPNLFAPAEIFVNNVKTGKIYHAGRVNKPTLRQSLGLPC